MGHSLRFFTQIGQEIPKVVMGIFVARIDAQGLQKMGDSFFCSALTCKRYCQIGVGLN